MNDFIKNQGVRNGLNFFIFKELVCILAMHRALSVNLFRVCIRESYPVTPACLYTENLCSQNTPSFL